MHTDQQAPYRRGEQGASALAWVGTTLLAALIVVALASGPGPNLIEPFQCALTKVAGGQCATTASPGEPEADDGSRDDQARDAREDRRETGREDENSGSTSGSKASTPGGDPYPGGLGAGVPGTTPTTPAPPAWTAPDGGAGEWGSEDATIGGRATDFAAELAANALSWTWPAASRNLLHFLANSGETLEQDVDAMLRDVPGFSEGVDVAIDNLGYQAVLNAQQAGATGPVTYPVNTDWNGYYIGPEESKDWFYALGGISYNLTGSITVTPPATAGGQWTYSYTGQTNIRDQYNWDGGKSTTIGPMTVTDEQLAELHRQGLAQEFTAVGSSSSTTKEGTVP